MKKILIITFVAILLFCLAGAGYIHHLITMSNSEVSEQAYITIPTGQGFKTTAAQLYSQGLIVNEPVFYYLGRFSGQSTEVKAGHFQVDKAWNMLEILEHLTKGREALLRLQIPEGLTWWQTGRLLEEMGLVNYNEFKTLVHDQDFLKSHGFYGPTAEGFLYPETYYLSPTRDTGARRVMGILFDQFWASTRNFWQDMDFEEIYEFINLASLIEKETGASHEREIISGVFHNRVARNMLLQCDPTIIYGIGESFEGRIRRSQLDDADNLYNTYIHRGYPPTPICSPGLASIKAALNPKQHDYLYFVSRNDGTHHFSTNLREHNRAVHKYQRSR
ncbi:endolytic transglycosylase MltG [Desulfonatronovibrio magnus]|uniref:endolytic transglycosylase MltG n=1 Tax=Desulfonatronovibrio magnus TaxID=698827 RepID=UPI0005EB2607|nr:endolytic transglycosylase MltG [Desulfonatronovibrio magnus]